MPNSLITLLGTELTTNNNTGREVERPTPNQVIEKKINYQILYKMVESAIEEILLEYPNDPVVDELKAKIIKNLRPVIKQILPND
jgi:hypothetical protein